MKLIPNGLKPEWRQVIREGKEEEEEKETPTDLSYVDLHQFPRIYDALDDLEPIHKYYFVRLM